VFAVGTNNLTFEAVIRHHTHVGWSRVPLGRVGGLTSIWGSSSTDIFAGAEAGTMLHYVEL